MPFPFLNLSLATAVMYSESMNANCISTAYPEKINYYKKRECVHSAYIIDVKHVEYPSQEIKHFTCQFQCLLKKLSFSLYHQ